MLTNCKVAAGIEVKIMLVEESISSPSVLYETLSTEGYQALFRVECSDNLFQRNKEINPEMIVVDVNFPDSKLLAQLKHINEELPKPTVIFSETGDNEVINTAVQSGVTAFIVDGLSAKRVKPILNVALARFKNYSNLRDELTKAKENLANRKTIEKAKGIIMKQRHCSEDEAYTMLRKLAMDRNQRINDVAKNVIELSSLLI